MNDKESCHGQGSNNDPSTNRSFLSTMVALVAAVIVLVAMPLSYLGSFPLDLWSLGIVVVVLLVFRRFLNEPIPADPESDRETWTEFSIGMVHEVKNQLMDFHPEHYGDPATLADYLENTKSVLEETITRLREYAAETEQERSRSGEEGKPQEGHSA